MMHRQIFMPVPGSGANGATFETAARLAGEFGAHVQALYVQPDISRRLSQLVHGEGAAVMPTDMQAIIAGIDRGAQTVRAQFEQTMRCRAELGRASLRERVCNYRLYR